MKVARDSWLIFERQMSVLLHNPAWVVIGVLQPILYLVLFAPLLKTFARTPGFPPGGAYNVFVPGLLIQLGLFGATGVGFGLIAELRAGVVERFRVTPISRFGLLFGRAGRDIVVLMVQSLILLVLAVPFGLDLTFTSAFLMLGLVALIGLGMASIAYAVALTLKSEDAYAPLVFTVSLPLLLLSGVLLPLESGPGWLKTIGSFNPLYHAVIAARDLFNSHGSDPDVFRGLAIMLVVAIIGMTIGARSFSRAVA